MLFIVQNHTSMSHWSSLWLLHFPCKKWFSNFLHFFRLSCFNMSLNKVNPLGRWFHRIELNVILRPFQNYCLHSCLQPNQQSKYLFYKTLISQIAILICVIYKVLTYFCQHLLVWGDSGFVVKPLHRTCFTPFSLPLCYTTCRWWRPKPELAHLMAIEAEMYFSLTNGCSVLTRSFFSFRSFW